MTCANHDLRRISKANTFGLTFGYWSFQLSDQHTNPNDCPPKQCKFPCLCRSSMVFFNANPLVPCIRRSGIDNIRFSCNSLAIERLTIIKRAARISRLITVLDESEIRRNEFSQCQEVHSFINFT